MARLTSGEASTLSSRSPLVADVLFVLLTVALTVTSGGQKVLGMPKAVVKIDRA